MSEVVRWAGMFVALFSFIAFILGVVGLWWFIGLWGLSGALIGYGYVSEISKADEYEDL